MQFIKQFGKQLAFVVLMGSSVFSVSSAIAQVTPPPPVTSRILVNTDVIYPVTRLKCIFSCDTTTKLDVVQFGGRLNLDSYPFISAIKVDASGLYDPFAHNYLNNRAVGGSRFEFNDFGPALEGIFNEIPGNRLRLDLDYSGPNPPARAYNGTTCKDTNGCVILHYGYAEEVTSIGALTPTFFQTVLRLRDLNGNLSAQIKSMASPIVNTSAGGITEYLVVYHEQTDPVQPDVVISNWTQFPVRSVELGQIQSQKTLQSIVQTQPQPETLSFSNTSLNPGSITISNTRVLRSATEIPLERLNAIELPPTDPSFVPVPSVDGTIGPGETKPPVVVPPSDFTVLNNIVFFDGNDYLEIPNNENLNFGTEDLSISAWVKTTSTSGIEVVLDKRVETTGPIQGYSLVNFNGSLLLQLADGVGNEFTNYISNISIADGNWHHVAVTVDRDQPDGGRWYLNGVEVSGRFNPRRGSLSNSKPLVIGRRSDNPGSPGFFKGEISRVRLAKRVLSPQEIQALAANKP